MDKPYGLMSDQHCFAWDTFASLDSEGRNSRLMGIIAEMARCAAETRKVGGDVVFMGGDLFHTRGSVEPEVFNPVRDFFVAQSALNMRFVAICGNHDLASRESAELHSSVAMLQGVRGFLVYHKPAHFDNVIMVPWHSKPAEYLETIRACSDMFVNQQDYDLICHIGIDGTLSGMPDHGVSADKLASFGFKRMFSGHYHNFRDFGNGVYSIGSLTHQTWGDVGTRAGFLIVHPDKVVQFASHQPRFVDLSSDMDELDIRLAADGNYVRFKIGEATHKDIEGAKKTLLGMGAKGASIVAIPKTAAEKREGVTAKSLSSLGGSVNDYCTEKQFGDKTKARCATIIGELTA